jgi:hypothetical protein
LKRGILYAVDQDAGGVIIGPAYTIVGQSGKAHEFGGRYKRQFYPPDFMGPALDKNKVKIPTCGKTASNTEGDNGIC